MNESVGMRTILPTADGIPCLNSMNKVDLIALVEIIPEESVWTECDNKFP